MNQFTNDELKNIQAYLESCKDGFPPREAYKWRYGYSRFTPCPMADVEEWFWDFRVAYNQQIQDQTYPEVL